jgi:hypothetical protein
VTRSIQQQRAAGRVRAEGFTPEYQRAQGKKRAAQPSHLVHNRQIARDGHRAFSAAMRASMGIRLLHPEDVQFLRPEQFRGPQGAPLSDDAQRLRFGIYVWKAIWEYLAPQPTMPSDEEFLTHSARVRARLSRGMPLEDPLDIVFATPDDFCDATGSPWSRRRQRKLFRAAFQAGRSAAKERIAEIREITQAERMRQSHRIGQRRPTKASPMFQGQVRSEGGW